MTADSPPEPPSELQKIVRIVYAIVLILYAGIVVFGLYRSIISNNSIFSAVSENATSLAIFAACLALFAASYAGRKPK